MYSHIPYYSRSNRYNLFKLETGLPKLNPVVAMPRLSKWRTSTLAFNLVGFKPWHGAPFSQGSAFYTAHLAVPELHLT